MAIIALLMLFVGFVTIWPIPLDPKPALSLKLYAQYLAGRPLALAEVFGPVELVCAIGPYSSFQDPYVAPFLTAPQRAAAAAALDRQNLDSHGDNRIFMLGFRGDQVAAVYTSHFFASLPTQDKLTAAPSCIDGSGFISVETFENVIVIKLEKGM